MYHNPLTGETVVSHRGTIGFQDWMTDGVMAVGLLKNTERYKHAKIFKEKPKRNTTLRILWGIV